MPRPRIRTIKPDFWLDDDLLRVPFVARGFAIGLISFADDEGYGKGDIMGLAVRIVGDRHDPEVPSWYAALENVGFIKTHEVTEDGQVKRYYHVVNFLRHQRVDKPTPSEIRKRIGDMFTKTRVTSPPKVSSTGPTLAQRIWREDCEAVILEWSSRFGDGKAIKESQAGLIIGASKYSGVSPFYVVSKIKRDAGNPWRYFIVISGAKIGKGKTTFTGTVEIPDELKRTHGWQTWLERHRTQSNEVDEIFKALAEKLGLPQTERNS